MTAMRDTVSIDTFRRLVAAKGDDFKAFDAILAAEVRPALSAALEGLRREGKLRPVPGSAGHATPFLVDWNAFVRDDPCDGWDDPWTRMGRILAKVEQPLVVMPAFVAQTAEGRTAEEAEANLLKAYARMQAILDGGTCQSSGYETCEATGEAYFTHWTGLQPRLYARDGGSWVEMTPCERPAHRAFEVTFESGDLLVSDWIRIPEFTAVVDGPGRRDDLGSQAGREAMTMRYAEEFGFVGVHMDASSASVHVVDGCLVAGHPDPEDEPDDEPVGRLSGGYRGATVIDRARLVAILADALGAEAAEERVAAYLSDAGGDVLRVRVEPGVHHVYFGGDRWGFGEGFRPSDLDLGWHNPGLVIAPRTLDLEPGTGMAP